MGMLALFSDFGWQGPYVGQMAARALSVDERLCIVHLMHDAPRFQPRLAAYLLAAAVRALPEACAVCAVVDPGVGGPRDAIAVQAGRRWLVGPDNGLLSIAAREAGHARYFSLPIPAHAAPSFHGRDVFAPAAARLAIGTEVEMQPISQIAGEDWPDEIAEVIYIDGFGNVMLGLKADRPRRIRLQEREIPWARTFCDVPRHHPLCYRNALGLVEIAVREGSAAEMFSLTIGDRVQLID